VIVDSLADSADGVQVSFVDRDSAVLSKANPDWQAIRDWLSFSLEHRYPVGVLFAGAGQVAQAGMIDCNEVGEISENERHPHLLNVTFSGDPAPSYLDKEHPRYREMLDFIHRAVAARQRVWCVIVASSIEEVWQFTPEEDEALGRWIGQHGQGGAA
jgi:hypothetical protein